MATMYKTISYAQDEILHAINALYLDSQGIDLDPMYGKGGFYKQFPAPLMAGDITTGWDATDLREIIATGAVRSMILDPPFMHAMGKDSALKRYATYPSQKALRELYRALLVEAYRVLASDGILLFKCQDTVESGRQVWNHVWVQEQAIEIGFEPVDLFVQLARSRLTGHNHGRQIHARKHHCFWWVLRKVQKNRTKVMRKQDRQMTDADGNVWGRLPMETGNAS